jgi:hypothetical protein
VNTGNGKASAANSEELVLCRKYLNAIHQQDKESLKLLTTKRYDYFFDDIDLALWKTAYPSEIDSFEGFSNDEAATIQLRGKRQDEGESEWIFLLTKTIDGWKVHQTWPVTGFSDYMIWR